MNRARPLPPDERRAALIEATLPLVAVHGTKVTTRQIADAAGVAEGTIFRVFTDKHELVMAAIAAALDPEPLLAELAAIDLTDPLRIRLVCAVGILQHRLISIINLLTAVGINGPPETVERFRRSARPTHESIYVAIGRILEPDRQQLRYPIHEAARYVRLLTFSGSHPMINDGETLSPSEIVDILLDGVLKCSTGGDTC